MSMCSLQAGGMPSSWRVCPRRPSTRRPSRSPYLEFEKLPEHWLLTWSPRDTEDDERFGSVDGAGWMTRLALVREELMRGDWRGLYIGWLRAIDNEDVDRDVLEPMALQGLGQLTAAQQSLAEFLEVDGDLLAGLGMGAPANPPEAMDDAALDAWLDKLPKTEVRGYLLQMLNGQGSSAERALKRRHAAWQARSVLEQGERRTAPSRTCGSWPSRPKACGWSRRPKHVARPRPNANGNGTPGSPGWRRISLGSGKRPMKTPARATRMPTMRRVDNSSICAMPTINIPPWRLSKRNSKSSWPNTSAVAVSCNVW